MKNEMPPSTTSAPIAITTALEPLRPLLLDEDEVPVVLTTGGGVVVLGVVA